MTKAIQEKVILNEIKEISLNRIGGNIPKYFLLSDKEYYKKYIVSKIGMKNKNTKMKVYNCDKSYSRTKLKNIFKHIKEL